MKFLLFFLGIIFFFIFFLFSKIEVSSSIFSSLFIEAHIYIALAIVSIMTLTGISFWKNKKIGNDDESVEIESKDILPERQEILEYIRVFFGKYIYYIWTLLFYLWLMLIFKSIVWDIRVPQILLFFNIIVLSLYFFENKFPLFQDLIRVNTVIVSLYYIARNILFLSVWGPEFLVADLINIFLVIVLFVLFFVSSQKKSYIPTLASYFLVFIFLELSVVMKVLGSETIITMSFLSFIIGLITLIFTREIAHIWAISKTLVRVWGLCFSYMFLTLAWFHIFSESFMAGLFTLFVWISSYLLYSFHLHFQNYISFFFSSIGVSLIAFSLYMFLIPEAYEYDNMFYVAFILSFLFLSWEKIIWVIYFYDRYFFRIFSLLVNIVWLFCFFFFIDISILKIWVLLLGESVYFLYSYYSLKSIKI